MSESELEYVGFWARVGATLIDTLLITVISAPLLTFIYGKSYWLGGAFVKGPADLLISWAFPIVAVIAFWIVRQATPGKMAFSARIVDAESGQAPSTGQCIIRYLGYFVSMLPLFLGIIWVAFDRRKQGWHDKLAGTVVVRKKGPEAATFKDG